jgi:cathepsin B
VVGRFGSVDKEIVKRAILRYGAVTTAFFVYEDFYHYTGGVYQHSWGSKLGGHAITVIGWGNENGKDYWLTQNSWG